MSTGEWFIVGVVVVATVTIIVHNEWRYRRLVEWLDAVGEMIGEFIDSQKGK
jgi:hypothetical protein